MNVIRSASACALSIAAAAAGCAADLPETGSARGAITAGAPDPGDPAVVALVSGEAPHCTGTLVSPRVVITAAHCLDGRPLSVFFGASLDGPGERREAADQRAHPDFGALDLTHDIGAVLLDEPAPSSIAPVPMRLAPLPDPLPGTTVRLVGFGKTSGDPAALAGQKREGTTQVVSADARTFTFGPAPSQTCMGDSGGPAFMTFEGVEMLVGVTSAGDSDCAEYGRDTRLDAYGADFVLPYLRAVAATGARVGERCLLADNCAPQICYFPADAPTIGYCSSPCAADSDCPDSMFCERVSAACRYPAPSPGALGAPCERDDACDGRVCARPEGYAAPICTSRCLAEVPETCPSGAACVPEADAGTRVCVARGGGGCAIRAGEGGAPFAAILLALALLAPAWRRASSPRLARRLSSPPDTPSPHRPDRRTRPA